nr:reverse transcriptase domain-containing protein [Tanacetum cinerariifolium]
MSREAWVRAVDASDLVHGEVMSLRTTVLGQMSKIRELQAVDRRRQTVISKLLRIDHMRSTKISKLRTTLQGQLTALQGQVTALQAQVTTLQGQQGLAGDHTRPFEELSDIGSPRADDHEHLILPEMLEDLYVEVALQAPPSPDYIPGPEEPEQALPLPDYVLGPEHTGDEIVAEDQPYDEDASPIAQSPEYVPESDFEAHPEDDDDEDPEEDPALSAEETEPFETDEFAATPPPHPAYRTTARISIPAPVPMPAWTDSELPSASRREDRPDVTLPPRKRLDIALGPRYEVGESSSAAAARPAGGFRVDYGFFITMDREIMRDLEREIGYGITDSWDEIVETLQGAPVSTDTELGRYVREFETRVRQDTDEIYMRLDDEQTERQLLAGRLNMLFRNRRAHAYTRQLMETEARMSREAWVRATDASDLVHGEVMSLRTTVLGQILEIRELQAADPRRQTVISELLRIDHRRSTDILELRTALQGQKQMAPRRTTRLTVDQETINATTVTNAQLQAMIDQGVTTALAARDALRSTNGDDSHNSGTGTVGHEAAYGMSWKTLMKMMTDKYCPRNETRKLEMELWDLMVNGTDLASYTQCFQELALLCERMFSKEADKIKKYVGADGRIIGLNTILRSCTINLLNHPFNIDLMPVELGSFDAIIGMDWLAKYQAVIVCAEKIVCIPWGNETLIIHGDGSNRGNATRLSIISCTKTEKYVKKGFPIFLAHITTKEVEDKSEKKRLEDVPIVRDFPEVFPEDLPGLPPI